MTDFIYILVPNNSSWEDLTVFTIKEDAIAVSIKYPQHRVELFAKDKFTFKYTPTYNYYKNGEYVYTTIPN